jgi:hypothetical protein
MMVTALLLGTILGLLAFVVAKDDRAHWGVAVLFAWCAVGDWVQFGIYGLLSSATRPYQGVSEVAFHFAHFFLFSREFLLASVVLHTFRQSSREAWLVMTFGMFVWALTLDYPHLSQRTLQLFYVCALVLSQLIVWWVGIQELFAPLAKRRVKPSLSHLSLFLWSAMTLCLVANGMKFLQDWRFAFYATLIVVLAEIALHLHRIGTRAWNWISFLYQ